MTPSEITQWCDNEGAVMATNKTSFHTPSEMLAPDADIILAIMHHRQNSTYKIRCNHILSHQDTKKRKSKEEKEKDRKLKRKERRQRIREVDVGEGTHAPSPPPTPPQSPSPSINIISDDDTSTVTTTRLNRELGRENLSDAILMNVACDEIAGKEARERLEHPDLPLPPAIQPPYAGSKAMLKIGKVWITSNYDKHIHFASRVKQIRAYCRYRHKWSRKTMRLVNWNLIGQVRKNRKWPSFVTTMKIMHGWLPIMHNIGKYKDIKQCPGCECNDETFIHLFNCTHPLMTKSLQDILKEIHEKGIKSNIKHHFMDKFMTYLEYNIKMEPIPLPNAPAELRKAINDQNKIGPGKMLQGYFAKSWIPALIATGTPTKYVHSAM
jgi:hypothetical protein